MKKQHYLALGALVIVTIASFYFVNQTPKDNNALTKSLITVLVTAGTGGRLTEDWNPSQHPQSTVPDPFGK